MPNQLSILIAGAGLQPSANAVKVLYALSLREALERLYSYDPWCIPLV